jgi:hypothetical protein
LKKENGRQITSLSFLVFYKSTAAGRWDALQDVPGKPAAVDFSLNKNS